MGSKISLNNSSSEKTIIIVPLGNVPPEHVKATAMQPPTLVQLGLKQSAEMSSQGRLQRIKK